MHDQIKANLWKQKNFQEKAQYGWIDAVVRWSSEVQHKRTLCDDKAHLKWLDPYLGNKKLQDITRTLLDKITQTKLEEGVKPSTANRMLAVVRAILRKAEREWEWIDKAPFVRLLKEDNKRIRWITREEASRLLKELPEHLADMASFNLVTGLRASNITELEWTEVDLVKRHAWIHPDQAKAEKAIPVPLNSDAIEIIRRQLGKHEKYVFTYKGQSIVQCNTKAWRKALKRAGIDSFRWHDLRHTWASWHVQNGTSLQELQQLGGWASYTMVLRYAHLSSDHLRKASERVSVTNLSHDIMKPEREGR